MVFIQVMSETLCALICKGVQEWRMTKEAENAILPQGLALRTTLLETSWFSNQEVRVIKGMRNCIYRNSLE